MFLKIGMFRPVSVTKKTTHPRSEEFCLFGNVSGNHKNSNLACEHAKLKVSAWVLNWLSLKVKEAQIDSYLVAENFKMT